MCKDLSTSGNFSECFQKLFGEHNLQDPNTPSTDIIEYIQSALIEQRLTIDDEESRLQLLDSNFPRAISKNTHNLQNYCENPFSNTDSKQKTQKYIALYANFKQLRMHEGRDELAKICQYTEERLFGLPNPISAEFKENPCETDEGSYLVNYFPLEILIEDKRYNYQAILPIYRHTDKMRGALVHYTNNTSSILIPAYFKALPRPPVGLPAHYLVPGLGTSKPVLLGEHDLNRNHSATVFLCANPLVADELNKRIADSRRLPQDAYIATSWYGGQRLLEHTDFGGLYKKNIIFLPALHHRKDYLITEAVFERCKLANAQSFKVLPSPVLLGKTVCNKGDGASLPDALERFCIDTATWLEEEDSIVLQRMEKASYGMEQFRTWSNNIGLTPTEPEVINSPTQSNVFPFSPDPQLQPAQDSDEIFGIDAFVSPKELGVILAPTHAGKTQLALAIAVAHASGTSLLNFTALPLPQRVFFVDGETQRSRLEKESLRIAKASGGDMHVIEKNLHFRYVRDEQSDTEVNLSSPDFQAQIEADIKELHVNLIIFDNLISLLPGFRSKGGKYWELFILWTRKLEQNYGVSILLVHHTNSEKGAAGTQDIEAQCKNVVLLEGRGQLEAECKKEKTPFLPYMGKPGTIFRITFQKCKKYPALHKKQFGAFLGGDKGGDTVLQWEPIGLNAEPSRSKSVKAVDQTQAIAETPIIVDWANKYPDLKPDAIRILEYASMHDRFKRSDIDSFLDCKDSKSNNLLNLLVNKQLLGTLGQQKNRQYQLRQE